MGVERRRERWLRMGVLEAGSRWLGLLSLLLFLTACWPETGPGAAAGGSPVDHAAVREELLRLDREFDIDSAERGSLAWHERFAEDGQLLGGSNVVVGPDAVKESVAAFDTGQVTLRWEPLEAVVSESGDLGYTRGTYERRTRLGDGNEVVTTGGYVTIWKRLANGVWRIALDVGSPDPPPPPAAGTEEAAQ